MDQNRQQKIKDILAHLNLELQPAQEGPFWSEAPSTVVSAGEGFGKSVLGSLRAVAYGLTDPDTKLVWVVGAIMEDAYKELHGTSPEDWSILRTAEELGVLDRDGSTISTHSDQKERLHIFAPGTLTEPPVDFWVQSISGHDPRFVGRDEPDIIIGAEVSHWESELWQRCQGRLARKPGSWGYFSGSPEYARSWFNEVTEMGQAANLAGVKSFYGRSSDNRVIYPGGEDDPALVKLRDSMSTERYEMRHLGRPGQPQDMVLPEFKVTLHVRPVSHEEGFPTYVFIDPGTRIYAVLFVQLLRDKVHVLDEVYMARGSHEEVVNAAMTTPAWKYVREGVIDVAAHQSHFGLGTPEEHWYNSTGLRLQASFWKVSQTVERLRSMLMVNPSTQNPRLVIDPKCRGLIAELGGGQTPVVGSGPWLLSGAGQPKAENDHACKALGYGLLAHFGAARPNTVEEDDDAQTTYLNEIGVGPGAALDALLRSGHSPVEESARTSLSDLLGVSYLG